MTRFTKALRVGQFLVVALGLVAAAIWAAVAWLKYPEHDYTKVLPPLSDEEDALVAELAADTRMLSDTIGPRNVTYHPDALRKAADYLETEWLKFGFAVKRQTVPSPAGPSDNLFVDLPGKDPNAPVIIFGAHYDSYRDAPGANDNATGVAALLALSRHLPRGQLRWPVRFIAFTNEEPPEYKTEAMGSTFYAENLGPEPVAMMMSLETIGFYTDEADSQIYPWPLAAMYPTVGDFVAIVGDFGSRQLTTRLLEGFRRASNLPAGAVTLPDFIEGAGWSDHWAFWQKGIPAVMLTDTAFFRYPYYHTRDDTIVHLNFKALARVVTGFMKVLEDPAFEAVTPYRFRGLAQ